MSCPEDKIKALSDLHIVPVSISYEWESCDVMKAIELYESRLEKYIKKPGEDLTSILTGIIQHKGRVNFTLGDEVTEDDLIQYDSCTNNDYHRLVAQLLDERINGAYKLYPNNYVAHDIRHGQTRFAAYYTPSDKMKFMKYMECLNDYDVDDIDILKDLFLGIYANPVSNKIKLGKI